MKNSHGEKVFIKEDSYTNIKTKCTFVDIVYGEWEAVPDLVLRQKTKHPNRSNSTSKPELEILNFVKNHFPSATKKFFGKIVKFKKKLGYSIDVYVPQLNKGIEFDGDYWHSPKIMSQNKKGWTDEEIQNYHVDKDSFLLNKFKIKILHIKESEWKKNKKECESKILHFLKESL